MTATAPEAQATGTVVTTNLATNPGGEAGGILGWNPNDGAVTVVSVTTVTPISGTRSVLSTRQGTLTSEVASMYLAPGEQPVPVIAGVAVTVGVDVKVEQAARTVSGYLAWLGHGASTQVTIPAGPPGVTVRLVFTGTPPPGTTQAYPVISVEAATGNAVTGERVWFDNLSITGDPSGVYFDGSTPAGGGFTYRWTGTPNASTSEKLASVPLTLTWWEDYGAVRFTSQFIPAGFTVYIIAPGDRLQQIRGYEDDTWHPPNGPGLGYSFEMPMGVVVRYGIAPVGAVSWPGAGDQAAILTPQNQAWLRDLYDPGLSRRVAVLSTGTESRPARQSVLKISGRPKPVVLWDVREARQGTVVLAIANDETYPTLWRVTEKDRIDQLLDTGRPLLLSLCQSKDFPPCYMAVTDSSYTRINKQAAWVLELTYVEIDNPVDVPVMIPPEVTYTDRMAGDPTYQGWLDTYPDYLALATEEV